MPQGMGKAPAPGRMRGQRACKPGSVHRTDRCGGRPFIWDDRCRPPLAIHPDGDPQTDHLPSLYDLAPGGVYHARPVARTAVRSYRTLSPLPHRLVIGGDGRFAFCGTFPGVASAGRYPAPCLRGARTFLPDAPRGPSERPPGPLTIGYVAPRRSHCKRHASPQTMKRFPSFASSKQISPAARMHATPSERRTRPRHGDGSMLFAADWASCVALATRTRPTRLKSRPRPPDGHPAPARPGRHATAAPGRRSIPDS